MGRLDGTFQYLATVAGNVSSDFRVSSQPIFELLESLLAHPSESLVALLTNDVVAGLIEEQPASVDDSFQMFSALDLSFFHGGLSRVHGRRLSDSRENRFYPGFCYGSLVGLFGLMLGPEEGPDELFGRVFPPVVFCETGVLGEHGPL